MPSLTYGYRFTWRQYGASAYGFKSKRDSHENLAKALVDWGWTPTKWWEFWRWGEQMPPEGAARIACLLVAEARRE